MYQTVRGSIPALAPHRNILPAPKKQTKDTPSLSTSQTMYPQLTTYNTRCFIVPTTHTEQFKTSFFVKKKKKTIE